MSEESLLDAYRLNRAAYHERAFTRLFGEPESDPDPMKPKGDVDAGKGNAGPRGRTERSQATGETYEVFPEVTDTDRFTSNPTRKDNR